MSALGGKRTLGLGVALTLVNPQVNASSEVAKLGSTDAVEVHGTSGKNVALRSLPNGQLLVELREPVSPFDLEVGIPALTHLNL